MSAESLDTRNDSALGISDAVTIDSTVPFILGDWRIDPSARCATRNDEVIKIDPRNMRVLQILVERHGQIVSQRELEALAWEGVVVTPDSLYQAIRQLRQALQDTKSPAKYIETVPRRGYRMVAEPRTITNSDAACALSGRRDAVPEVRRLALSSIVGRGLFATTVACLVSVIALSYHAKQSNEGRGAPKAAQAKSEANTRTRLDTPQEKVESATSFRMLKALASDALRAGKPHEAIEYFERALQRQLAEAGEENQRTVDVLVDLASTRMWLDDESAARDDAIRALSIADRLGPTSSPDRIDANVF